MIDFGKERFFKRMRLTRDGKILVAGISLGVILVSVMLFFFIFRVTDVKVAGNTRYSDEAMIQYVQEDVLTSNTVLTSWFRKHIVVNDVPFVESLDIETLDNNTIRIYVNEKQIVGYVVAQTDKLYFDKDGYILEAVPMSAEEIMERQYAAQELEMLRIEAERQEQLGIGNNTEDSEAEEDIEADEEEILEETKPTPTPEMENTKPGQMQPAVSDVPRILGLEMENLFLGQKIYVENENVFNTILGISRMASKYKIIPEIVLFDEEYNLTLVYQNGTIHCQLGPDAILEEKITRVAAILPHLTKEVGILHLEEYHTDTENIIFSKESEYTLKSKINTFLQKNS